MGTSQSSQISNHSSEDLKILFKEASQRLQNWKNQVQKINKQIHILQTSQDISKQHQQTLSQFQHILNQISSEKKLICKSTVKILLKMAKNVAQESKKIKKEKSGFYLTTSDKQIIKIDYYFYVNPIIAEAQTLFAYGLAISSYTGSLSEKSLREHVEIMDLSGDDKEIVIQDLKKYAQK